MILRVIVTIVLFVAGSLTAYEYLGDQVKGHQIQEFFEDQKSIDLSIAAARGDERAIKQLLSEGARINDTGKDNMTSLMWAFGARNRTGFQALLENGADPNIIIRGGDSVMTFAAGEDDPWFLEEALKYGGNPNFYNPERKLPILVDTVSPGKLEHIKLLIEFGADVNTTDASGETALMAATTLNQYDIVYYMLKQGADYHIKDKWGTTIIDVIEDRLNRNLIDPDNKLYEWCMKVVAYLRDRGEQVHLEP
ncbi:ankyrin repeat domain-containing protein [Marinomonas mediterranea]|jgi:FOG: Ankyrin repeat|uniref:Ankyrin n=1 Tax=Marinomonas mediterranea (strain ATCC 700492 / JCM 21426 / NBRC 103028 / MMB-1) TaxID=717774 RepID=F2K1M3_MARM1|nr:ankyrin repeat domain-containing protein [Marinomonas mediterranea]ADZ92253.1 Ankyrin [Marinomonas mediterranea MMB-1]WCN10210.1 hypothetical protein GV055_15480 [Marinomonas mediterranea]WCN14255.1 hypothetical protein GV054_15270 [Marinomonas mediterranea]WCN18311.1 hypothetical protein GV053_15355 [Marinomonas mediterranea MMB-1]